MFAFGALALVISGVGIANIMVASVAERAAEIGIRRAVGASRRGILAQFAIEALVLSLGGAAAGLACGLLGAVVAARLVGWPIAVSAGSVVIAMGVASVVGLAAGLYPARVAAALSPIDALRG